MKKSMKEVLDTVSGILFFLGIFSVWVALKTKARFTGYRIVVLSLAALCFGLSYFLYLIWSSSSKKG